MIKLFDDALPKEDQNYLEDILLGSDFPYYFRDNTSYDYQQDTCQFQHNFRYFGKDNSKYFEEFYGKFKPFIEKNSPFKNVLRMKTNLLLNNKANCFNSIHTDYYGDHINLIYYVNNSDGDTFIFDDGKIKNIRPKKGRILLFDGKYEHASSNPIESKYRSIINFNLVP